MCTTKEHLLRYLHTHAVGATLAQLRRLLPEPVIRAALKELMAEGLVRCSDRAAYHLSAVGFYAVGRMLDPQYTDQGC